MLKNVKNDKCKANNVSIIIKKRGNKQEKFLENAIKHETRSLQKNVW
jgi:hypothetical protein